VFKEQDYTSPYFGDNVNVDHLVNNLARNGWNFFILNNSQGLTKPGIQSLNDSIRNYVILILGCQVETRSQIVGNSGKRFDAQKLFLTLFNSSVNQSKTTRISDDISRFQDYITKAKIHLNYVIGPNLYLISDNLVMNLNSHGYNNQLIVGKQSQLFGINPVNQTIIPRVPLMDGSKPKVQLLSTKKINHKKSLTLSKPSVKATDDSHGNVKLALFLLSSFGFGLAYYFK
jgi:hypothetical protein